jgi:nitronate monooxygenase
MQLWFSDRHGLPMNALLQRLGIELPIIQAPMANVSTPAMAAAVSNAGALGSVAVGHVDAKSARAAIAEMRALTARPFNVNVFCHHPPKSDPDTEADWLKALAPHFTRHGAEAPQRLQAIYPSFVEDDAALAALLEARPHVVSFHFGLPSPERINALRGAGIVLVASATNLAEARAVESSGIDAVVAQGYEAGGHRGVFDLDVPDECLGTMALTRLLAKTLAIPVIAAGGIMDGAGIAASLMLGASAAQLGTAFVACPESAADVGFRAALLGDESRRTVMTRAISGRPARSLVNKFTALGDETDDRHIPAYPIAYDAGKALHAAAKSKGEYSYGAQWAGQGAQLARSLPAAELVALLRRELEVAIASARSHWSGT